VHADVARKIHQNSHSRIAMQTEPSIVSKQGIGAASQDVVNNTWHAMTHFSKGDLSSASQMAFKYLLLASEGFLALIVAYFVAKFASRIFSTPIQSRVDETLGKFVGRLIFYSIMIATIIGVVSHLGYDVTSFAAVLAAAGFAIGLAFQGTLSNFASGILLLVFRPFKVGDMVVVSGTQGTVYEIDLFATAIDTPDNRRIILPNSAIAGNTIENMTHHQHRRIEVPVGVAYDSDLMATRNALTEAAISLGDIVVPGESRGYTVIVANLGPHSVDWFVQAWVKTAEVKMAREILTVAIKESLDAAGLRIPFPQLDIHWQGIGIRNPEASAANELAAEADFQFTNAGTSPRTFTQRNRAG